MRVRALRLLLAGLTLLGLEFRMPLLAQAPATVVIVIDDTQVRPGDGRRVAELIDRLERDVLDSRTTFGIVTVGPAGLNVDLTRERRRLREASEAARVGKLDFTLTPNPDMAADALVASLQSVVSGLARRSGPKAMVVVGRATPAAEKRHAEWLALRRTADAVVVAWVWFDLGREGCRAATPSTDASVATKEGMCAALSSGTDTAKVSQALAHAVGR